MSRIQEIRDLNTVIEDWYANYSHPTYNPIPTLLKLIDIVHPKLYKYFGFIPWTQDNIEVFLNTIDLLHDHQVFIRQLINIYSSEEYGKSIGLTTEESDMLQVASSFLIIAYMVYVMDKKDNIESDRALYSDILALVCKYDDHIFYYALALITNMVDKQQCQKFPLSQMQVERLIVVVLAKFRTIFKPPRNRVPYRGFYRYTHYELQAIKLDLVDQRTCVFQFLNAIKATYEEVIIEIIFKYKLLYIFFECFEKNNWNTVTPAQRIVDGLYSFAHLFFDERICIMFIEAEGINKLVKVADKKIMSRLIIRIFYMLSCFEQPMKLVCLENDSFIRDFLYAALWILNTNINSDKPNYLLLFFQNICSYEKILAQFARCIGIACFNSVLRNTMEKIWDGTVKIGESSTVYIIEPCIDALKQYALMHLYYTENALNNRIQPNIMFAYDENEIGKKIRTISRLGKGDIFGFFEETKKASLAPQKFYGLIYLLLDIIRTMQYYHPKPFTANATAVIDNTIDITQRINLTELIGKCLDVIRVCCIDMRTMAAIYSYNKRSMEHAAILCFIKAVDNDDTRHKALQVINNCLWIPLCRCNVASDAGQISNALCYKQLFFEVIRMVRHSGDFLEIFDWFRYYTEPHNFPLVMSIFALLSFDKGMKNVIIFHCVRHFTTEMIQVLMHIFDNDLPILHEQAVELAEIIMSECKTRKVRLVWRMKNSHLEIRNNSENDSFDKMFTQYLHTKSNLNKKNIIHDCCTECVDYPTISTSSSCGKKFYVGINTGNIFVNDVNTSYKIAKNKSVSGSFHHLEINNGGNLMISNFVHNEIYRTVIWNAETLTFSKIQMTYFPFAEFSKLQDKMIGSSCQVTEIYDVNTEQQLCKFISTSPLHYTDNCATFSQYDHMILSDGTLWDVRSGKKIYKFDEVNKSHFNGIFHPNNNEIIFDQCIWDMRNHSIVKYPPGLCDRRTILASANNHAMYALNNYDDLGEIHQNFFDVGKSSTYSLIDAQKTYNTENYVVPMAIHLRDKKVAVIKFSWMQEPSLVADFRNVVQLYDEERENWKY